MKKAWKISLDVKQLDPEYSRKDKIKKIKQFYLDLPNTQ